MRDYVCNKVLDVNDHKMTYNAPRGLLDDLCSHFEVQGPRETKRKEGSLVYGCPGLGKTRLLLELVLAMCTNAHSTEGSSRAAKGNVASYLASNRFVATNYFPVVLTFNSQTPASKFDVALAKLRPDLPVFARVFYVYFRHEHNLNKKGFSQFIADFTHLCLNKAMKLPSLRELLAQIHNVSGRKHVVLLIDETLHLHANILSRGEREDLFIRILAEINALQDRISTTADGETYPVLFTGLLDGPWKRDVGRPLQKFLLQPLRATAAAISLIKDLPSFASWSGGYKTVHLTPDSTENVLADYLFRMTAGLPRAIEVLRFAFPEHASTSATLLDLVKNCARSLHDRYADVTPKQVIHLALYGQPVERTVGGTLLSELHTYMSNGNCLLISDIASAELEATVMIPPLRLLARDFSPTHQDPFARALGAMIKLVSEMQPRHFESFLLHHEVLMRHVRTYISSNTGPEVTKHCNFREATCQQVYFLGQRDHNVGNIKVEWATPSLRQEKFDFTQPLHKFQLAEGLAFVPFKKAEKYVNHVLISGNVNQKGYESGMIMKSSTGKYVAILEQNKFSMIEASQEAREVSEIMSIWDWSGEEENVVGNEEEEKQNWVKDNEMIVQRVLSLEILGWPVDNIIVLFRTNMRAKTYRAVLKGVNVILMYRDSLESYLGPTVWNLLLSSESLSNLEAKCI